MDKPTDLRKIEELLRQGRKIEAISEYHRQTRAGLKVSKDAVDAMEKKIREK